MWSTILLFFGALTLVLDFVADFQNPDQAGLLPPRLRSRRAHLIVRTTVLGIAFIGLGVNQFQSRQEQALAETRRVELQARIDNLKTDNAELKKDNALLIDQSSAVRSLAQDIQSMIQRTAVYTIPTLNTNPHGVVDFGTIARDSDSPPKTFLAMNIGTGQCAVDVTVTDKNGQSGFRISRSHIDLRAQVQETFEVTFHPTAPGAYEAELMIRGTSPCSYDNPTLRGVGR